MGVRALILTLLGCLSVTAVHGLQTFSETSSETLVAQAKAEPLVDAWSKGGTVFVNGVPVFELKTVAGGRSAAERASTVAQALNSFAANETIKVVADPGLRLLLGSRPVLTITAAEAQAQKLQPEPMAQSWARAINKALYLPPLVVSPDRLRLPIDKPLKVSVTGRLARRADLNIEPKDLITLSRVDSEWTLRAKKQGQGTATFGSGANAQVMMLQVLPYATSFPQNLEVEVTGQPATAEVVQEAIRTALNTMLKAPGQSRVSFSEIKADPLAPGERRVYQTATNVEASDHFPASGFVNILVKNIGGGRTFEDVLWYSNEPENVRWSGQLYWGRLQSGSPVRLLWHHFNKGQQPMAVSYVLANRSDKTARVSVMSGDADPLRDPTRAGYLAGDKFFSDWLAHRGVVISIPPRGVVPFVLRDFQPGFTVSGLASLQLLTGGSDDVVLVGHASFPGDLPEAWRGNLKSSSPWSAVRTVPLTQFDLPLVGQPKHVYQKPSRTISFVYKVGGPLQFLRVGEESINSVNEDRLLDGNFGVHYLLEGRLENPSNRRTTVEAVFEASAGYAGAVFLVNGKYLKGDVLPTKRTLRIFEATLNPGEAADLRIETIPLSGAHYPVTITLRPKE